MRKRQVPYTEKLVENLIRDYPLDLLGESLIFDRQQPVVEGLRPDLIFNDAQGRTVIVEVQVNALDRYHLYKCLEYRDLLLQTEKSSHVRVILFRNELPNRYSNLLKTHQIEITRVSKGEVIRKAHFFLTDVEVIDSRFTTKKLLHLLAQKRNEPIGSITGLVVFWTFPYGISRDQTKDVLGSVKLLELVNDREFYFSDSRLRARKQIGEDEKVVPDPNELFLPKIFLDELGHERLSLHETWLELLAIFFSDSEDQVYVTLGWRGEHDVYGFESYVQSNIKKFIPLWELFDAIEVKSGPGRLVKNIKSTRESVRRSQGEQAVVRFDQFIRENVQSWATISVRGCNRTVLKVALSFVRHLLWHHCNGKKMKVDMMNARCATCLAQSRSVEDINPSTLRLSSQYFEHLHVPTVASELTPN